VTTADERLAAGLAAEHAAVFAYGTVGAYLPAPLVDGARQAEAEHRRRRDALLLSASNKSQNPAPAEPAYALPFPVVDQATAVRLAVQVEERTAAVWRAALPDTTGEHRKFALDALVDAAQRAARWRRAGGANPGTVALPGAPA